MRRGEWKDQKAFPLTPEYVNRFGKNQVFYYWWTDMKCEEEDGI